MSEHDPRAALESFFALKEIKGKQVFVVDDHHKALAAWVLVRRTLEKPPVLISLDHHTDTLEAFSRRSAGPDTMYVSDPKKRAEMLAGPRWGDDASVVEAIERLEHDEHIDAAARCDILRAAFCVNLDNRGGDPHSIEESEYQQHREDRGPLPPELPPPGRPFHYEAPVKFEALLHCAAPSDTSPARGAVLQATAALESALLSEAKCHRQRLNRL